MKTDDTARALGPDAAMRRVLLAFVLLAAWGCDETRPRRTVGPRDADASRPRDATAGVDASSDGGGPDGGDTRDGGARDAGWLDGGTPDAGRPDARRPDAGAPDAASPDAGSPDAGGGQVFDVEIFVANTCEVSTVPASISVPAGTAFTVNWINQPPSASNVDIDKIDRFNQVPLIIGLEPGNAWHDTVRQWCGPLFMGTFSFRITGCFDPYFLDVDCGG